MVAEPLASSVMVWKIPLTVKETIAPGVPENETVAASPEQIAAEPVIVTKGSWTTVIVALVLKGAVQLGVPDSVAEINVNVVVAV